MLPIFLKQANQEIAGRGKILRTLTSGSVIALILFLWSMLPVAEAKPMRGLWVVRHNLTSPARVRQVFEVARRCDITDLFMQVRGRGDAYYRSDFVPAAENITAGFDPLDYCLQLGRQYGIRVHAWMNVFLLWSAASPPSATAHPVRSNPEWLAQNAQAASNPTRPVFPLTIPPGTEGVYLSPGNPEAREYLVRVVTELASKYPVDGIHFDYIRYPNLDYDYSYIMRTQFHTLTGVDPLVLYTRPQEIIRSGGQAAYREMESKWVEFRQQQVSRFLIDVRENLPRKSPPFLISAAVKPDPETGRNRYYQDWIMWVKKKLIDLALPMNYTASLDRFEEYVQSMLNEISAERLCVGVGLYTQSKYRVVSKVYKLRAMGIRNFCFFSYDTLIENPETLSYVAGLP